MQINLILNGTKVSADVAADTLLLDLVRRTANLDTS